MACVLPQACYGAANPRSRVTSRRKFIITSSSSSSSSSSLCRSPFSANANNGLSTSGVRVITPRGFPTSSSPSSIVPATATAAFTTARRLRQGDDLRRRRGFNVVVSAGGDGGSKGRQTGAPEPSLSPGGPGGGGGGPNDEDQFRRWLFETELPKSGKTALRSLSSLPLAISEFLVIAGFSALGTVIEQNKGAAWYVQNYPVDTPAFGFIDYPFILDFGLDHIYTEWYFLGLLGALAASLTACTFTRQLPVWRVSADWKFLDRPAALLKMEEAETLPRARSTDLADLLAQRGYQVFMKGKKLYAFKGLIGRLAPIGVHAGLLLTLGGAAYSGLGGLGGSVMVPEGTSFEIGAGLRRGQPFAPVPSVAKDKVFVNDFTIEYLPNGQVSQFFSDLSVVDSRTGAEKQRKTISVNVPLREGGVTMYQTDWEIASLQVKVEKQDEAAAAAAAGGGGGTAGEAAAPSGFGAAVATGSVGGGSGGGDSGPAPERLDAGTAGTTAAADDDAGEKLLLPMANLEGQGNFQGRIWGTFLPLNPGATDPAAARVGVSLLARDFQSVAVYGSDGSFAGVRRPGSGRPITVDGLQLVVEDMKGSTGLELKTDPGVPWVYAGFAGLMVTSFLSLLSHSQVWAVEVEAEGGGGGGGGGGVGGPRLLHVGGRSNRAKEEFKTELDEVLDELPEYL